MKLVLIEWADSRQPTIGWVRLAEMEQSEFCRCYSIGFVVKEDKETIALASNVADIEDGAQATGIIVIPRVAVLKTTALTYPSSLRLGLKQMQRQT